MRGRSIGALVLAAALFYIVGYELIWKWMICRIHVEQGQSLQLRYKGTLILPSPPVATGDFAKVDEDGSPLEVGIMKEMLGPGRHFVDPIHYERILVDDIIVEPGQMGMVTSKLGKDLPAGQLLVDGDVGKTEYKGILRKVLKPGRYRINQYGYDVKLIGEPNIPASSKNRAVAQKPLQIPESGTKQSNWLEIPPGYVGVVTNLAPDERRGIKPGIQDEVLQPGIYTINGREQQIDVISIGYQPITVKADLDTDQNGQLRLDENGEPVVLKGGHPGINFPSKDGFPISLDFTAIWGIMPTQASKVISLFGQLDAVKATVIVPEIESICRIHGSKLGAVDLLTGDSREMFQRDVSDDFRRVLSDKDISLQVGLVRHIYIPPEVRGPIQKANIADEMKLTRDMEIETAKVEADLEEARASVSKDENGVVAETEKLYQEAMADGRKEVEEIKAETEKLVAAVAKETAEIEAKATLLLGQAEAEVETMKREAEAQKFAISVAAFGSPEAYNEWVFANGLPENLSLTLLYAGQGTFWTDLKGFQEASMGKLLEAQGTTKAEGTPTVVKPASPSQTAPVTAPKAPATRRSGN
jgi:regulator of protease activity HflC (stomatin/prohibitin superfamily)